MPDTTVTFSTREECSSAFASVRNTAERLPVDAAQDLASLLGALFVLEARIAAVPLVEHGKARGTHTHREVHGLPPINEGNNNK